MQNIGYYNGKIGLIEDMVIPMNDRAVYFGDGIYDATCCKNGVVFLAEEHIDRFFNNALLIDIVPDFTKKELYDLLHDLLKKVDADECFAYWQISRGTAKRNHIYPADVKPNLLITISPAPIRDIYKQIKVITSEDLRFLMCNIKTIDLLPTVIAAQKAEEAGAEECIFHRGNRVTECSHSNVHILKNGKLKTAPTDQYILPGIARAHIIKACKKLSIPVDETPFTLDELKDADEILISSSSKFCISANNLNGEQVGGKAPRLLKAIQDEVFDEFYTAVGVK
ncbi:MAG: aminotransferase class IV [Clostridia bacterium]|nr:aminotransferase class IV [Clostridia bacterium]